MDENQKGTGNSGPITAVGSAEDSDRRKGQEQTREMQPNREEEMQKEIVEEGQERGKKEYSTS